MVQGEVMSPFAKYQPCRKDRNLSLKYFHLTPFLLTERSRSSVVIPLIVRCMGFFANGARIITGSRKYPIERDSGQSCVTFPPEMTPGFKSIEVPDEVSSVELSL